MPRKITERTIRQGATIEADATIAQAVMTLRDSGMPALAVVNDRAVLVGLFGYREFFAALFPGYLRSLHSASYLTASLDEALEKRSECKSEPVADWMLTDHVEATAESSDLDLAEKFLHHRAGVIPVVNRDRHVTGYVTQVDFFNELAGEFVSQPDP
jgi:CBS-domain-containing membrane protein